MRRLIVLALLVLPVVAPARLPAQALDTSVTIQVRTRRASTGKTTVTATIVKLPAARVDTVYVPRPTAPVGTPVDTLVWVPAITAAHDSLRWTLESTADGPTKYGWKPPPSYPLIIRQGSYFYWHPVVMGDSIRWMVQAAPAGGQVPPTIPVPRR